MSDDDTTQASVFAAACAKSRKTRKSQRGLRETERLACVQPSAGKTEYRERSPRTSAGLSLGL